MIKLSTILKQSKTVLIKRTVIFCIAFFAIGCASKNEDKKVVRAYDREKRLVKEYAVNVYGQKNGIYKEYYTNGNVKLECRYEHNTQVGEQRQFYENGALQASGYFRNGQLDSVQRWFYQSGREKSEAYRLEGRFFGIQKEFDERGALRELYFMANDSDMAFSLTLDNSGNITKKQGKLLYTIYNKKVLALHDTLSVLFYTVVPPLYGCECRMTQTNKGVTRPLPCRLDTINNNACVLFTKPVEEPGETQIGLSVTLKNRVSGLRLTDSSNLSFLIQKGR